MQTINTFSKGLNTDADLSLVGKEQYLYAENLRIYTESGNTTGSLENITGNNLLSMSSYIPSNFYTIGYANIREELYLFITTNSSSTPSGGNSKILKVLFNSAGTDVSSVSVIYDDTNSSDGSRLNLSDANRIKAIGRYESDTIKKIYWVDGYNSLRYVNVANVPSNQPANKFDVIPNFNITQPQFSSFGSGILTSGRVQYAYQMYDLNGGETLFSPSSSLISISEKSGQTGSNKTFKGSDKGVNTGKGVKFYIQPPSGFTRIRVVSIKYDSINSTPVINIIADQAVSTNPSIIYFYDAGTDYLGSYTFEEFAVIGNTIFSAKEIETKDNRLFVGNLSQTDWDFTYDARAYRFVKSTSSGTLTTGYTAIFENGIWGTNNWVKIHSNFLINGTTSVPENHDCLNPYNDPTLDFTRNNTSPSFVHLYEFKYKTDGTTLGGSGLNVSYNFITTQATLSSTGTNYDEMYSYNTDYSNVTLDISSTGYQKDEVYRFGLVGYNEKGQSSTVKWIGDIRFPNYDDTTGIADKSTTSNDIYGKITGIRFTINTSSMNSQGVKYFKLVRVKREGDDRSILAQGLTSACVNNTDIPNSYRIGYMPNYTTSFTYNSYTNTTEKKLVEFISPEINFNKNISYKNGDRLDPVMILGDVGTWDNNLKTVYISTQPVPQTTHYSFVEKFHSASKIPVAGIQGQQIIFGQIVDAPITYPNGSVELNNRYGVDVGLTNKFVNWTQIVPGTTAAPLTIRSGPSGTKLILRLTNYINIDITPPSCLVCNYRRPIFNSQYNGPSYQSRQSNVYISASGLFQVTGGTITSDCYGGDTFIAMYDYLRNIIHQDIPEANATQLILYFPVETSISLRYRQDDSYSRLINDSISNKLLLTELAGKYTHISNSSRTLNQKTDLYIYNSVYSQENTTISYFPKSDVISSGIKKYDTRVMSSDIKINGELSDSWTKFKMDNFIDVDSTYGELTDLKNYKNILYFWQPKGFGALSVNQRSLLQDNNPGQLVLGTGGILDRYDYISNIDGCSNRFSVVAGLQGLYWIDVINKCVTRYNGNIENLSKIKGISTALRNLNINVLPTSCSTYDKNNNELLFKIYYTDLVSDSQYKVLSFNEILDTFNGVFTYNPTLFIKPSSANYISRDTLDTNKYKLWIHNIGNKGSFYGTTYQSKLSLVINDNYLETKTFDMFEYQTSSNIIGTDYTTDTFSSIRVRNDWQNSGFQSIVLNSNLTRKERGYKLAVPRNIYKETVSTSIDNGYDKLQSLNLTDTTRLFKERMRDKYLIVDLVYTNNYNKNFNIPYIITNYRMSKR